jgi:Protein of unknown function (DUF2510)
MPEPGWYDDPANPGLLAWWDGEAWQRQHTQPRPPQPRKKRGTGTVWILLGVMIILVALAIAIARGGKGATTPKAAAPTTTAPLPSTSPVTTSPLTVTTANAATCHPRSATGSCYEAGGLCPAADQGVTGVSGEGEAIKCQPDDGLRWVRT